MSEKSVLILDTKLFEDSDAVRASFSRPQFGGAKHMDLVPAEMGEQDWDNVVRAILSSTKVITV